MGKRISVLALATILAVFLFMLGCAPTVVEEETPEAAEEATVEEATAEETPGAEEPVLLEGGEEVTLELWYMPNGPLPEEAIGAEIEAFQKLYPNVTINATLLDWGSAWTKITAAAASGEGPDILQLGTTWVAAITEMGALMDLTDRVEEFGGPDVFVEASWSTAGIEGSGRITAIPWFVDVRAPYYRTDAFEKAGLDSEVVFSNWDEFEKALEKLNGLEVDGQKMAAVIFPGKNDWNVLHNFAPWVWMAGGDFVKKEGDKWVPAIADSASIDGAMYYTAVAANGYVPREALEKNTVDVESMWANGAAAITFSGPWLHKGLSTPEDQGGMGNTPAAGKYAVALYPEGSQGRYTFVGGSNLTVFGNTEHPEAAVELVRYLTSVESQVRYGAERIGMLPANKEALQQPVVTDDPVVGKFVENVGYGRAYPVIPPWGPLETVLVRDLGILWDMVAGVSAEKYSRDSVESLLQQAANHLKEVLGD